VWESGVPTKIVIDCDPGYDDALALLVALASPALEVLAVTTVAGNQTLEKVTRNALRLVSFAGRPDLTVAAGASAPLRRPLVTAEDVHGPDGLDGPRLPEVDLSPDERSAVEVLAQTLRDHEPGSVTLVPIGPLTNLARLVQEHPELVGAVKEVVLMGGSTRFGNTSAVAEFNIYVDPEAASVVFGAGWPITMVGLDVTSLATVTPDVDGRLRAIGTPTTTWVADMLAAVADRRRERGAAGPPAVHDVCAVACVIDPSIMTVRAGHVAVELRGEYTTGMTVVDHRPRAASAFNARVADTLALDRFWTTVLTALSHRTTA
jgi:purine nucleosidase